MRLDRFLVHSGLGSRKEVQQLIKKGLVTVNGKTVSTSNYTIEEYQDEICVSEQKIEYHEFYYILLNKPIGYESTTIPTLYPPVTDLVPEYAFAHLFPVGRLDVDTTGVLLLTNDGELAHRLLMPKFHVDKVYAVETDYPIPNKMIQAIKEGIVLDDEKTLPGELVILDDTHATLTIHQGKFHQVKRMFKAFGLTVMKLDRLSFSFLTHENLEQGKYRLLTPEEIVKLKQETIIAK